MDSIRARFGASGYAIAQLAARLAFDRATLGRGTTGTVSALRLQGLLDRKGQPLRCATVETFLNGRLAWSFDVLVDVNGRRADRAWRARQRRLSAMAMAADRVAFHRLDRWTLTPAGRAALAGAR